MNKKDISVIIPAYNESGTISEVISKIRELSPDFEIIVIDDGSVDNTAEIAAKAGAIVFKHPYNIGNGAAVKSVLRIAPGNIFIFMMVMASIILKISEGCLNISPNMIWLLALGQRGIKHPSFAVLVTGF